MRPKSDVPVGIKVCPRDGFALRHVRNAGDPALFAAVPDGLSPLRFFCPGCLRVLPAEESVAAAVALKAPLSKPFRPRPYDVEA